MSPDGRDEKPNRLLGDWSRWDWLAFTLPIGGGWLMTLVVPDLLRRLAGGREWLALLAWMALVFAVVFGCKKVRKGMNKWRSPSG